MRRTSGSGSARAATSSFVAAASSRNRGSGSSLIGRSCGEERRPGWGVGDAPLDEPLEAQLDRVQPAAHGVAVQSTAVVGGPRVSQRL